MDDDRRREFVDRFYGELVFKDNTRTRCTYVLQSTKSDLKVTTVLDRSCPFNYFNFEGLQLSLNTQPIPYYDLGICKWDIDFKKFSAGTTLEEM